MSSKTNIISDDEERIDLTASPPGSQESNQSIRESTPSSSQPKPQSMKGKIARIDQFFHKQPPAATKILDIDNASQHSSVTSESPNIQEIIDPNASAFESDDEDVSFLAEMDLPAGSASAGKRKASNTPIGSQSNTPTSTPIKAPEKRKKLADKVISTARHVRRSLDASIPRTSSTPVPDIVVSPDDPEDPQQEENNISTMLNNTNSMNYVAPMSPVIERAEVTQPQLLEMTKVLNKNITLHQDSITNVTSLLVTLKEASEKAETSAKQMVEIASSNKKKLNNLAIVLVDNQKAVTENTMKIEHINNQILNIQNFPPPDIVEKINKAIDAGGKIDQMDINNLTTLPEKVTDLGNRITEVSNDSAQVSHFVSNKLPDILSKSDRLFMFDSVVNNALTSFTKEKDIIDSKIINLQAEISAAGNAYNLNKINMETITKSIPTDLAEKLVQFSAHDISIKSSLDVIAADKQSISEMSNLINNKLAQMSDMEQSIGTAVTDFNKDKAHLEEAIKNSNATPADITQKMDALILLEENINNTAKDIESAKEAIKAEFDKIKNEVSKIGDSNNTDKTNPTMNAFTRTRIADITKTVYVSYNGAYTFNFNSTNEEIYSALQSNIETELDLPESMSPKSNGVLIKFSSPNTASRFVGNLKKFFKPKDGQVTPAAFVCVLPEHRPIVKEISALLREELDTVNTRYQIRPTYIKINYTNDLFPEDVGSSVLVFKIINAADKMKKIFIPVPDEDGFKAEDITERFQQQFGYANEHFDQGWILFGSGMENDAGFQQVSARPPNQSANQTRADSARVDSGARGQSRGNRGRGNRGRGRGNMRDKNQPTAEGFFTKKKDAIAKIPRI